MNNFFIYINVCNYRDGVDSNTDFLYNWLYRYGISLRSSKKATSYFLMKIS